MKFRYIQTAELELYDAALYYDSRRRGLGQEFSDEVASGITTILEAPERWPDEADGMRRYRLRRFPYGLFYRIVGDLIEIVAVGDLRRRPGYWRDRL